MTFEELSHYLRLGGATLAFILAASVLAIGVAVERWIALWNISANSRALTDAGHDPRRVRTEPTMPVPSAW